MSGAPTSFQRLIIIGTSGAGKTTLARCISHRCNIPHVELDALHWEPNWTEANPQVFRDRVEKATRGERWVLDGNYSKVRDIVWSRATTVVWLDYPFPLVMWRIIWRTLLRSLRREELWNGNRESFRQGFLSRDSVIAWAFTTYRRRRQEYPALFSRPEYSHLRVIRCCSPQETERWLATLVENRGNTKHENVGTPRVSNRK